MAVTNTLQRTINLSSIFIRNAGITNVGGFTNEPAFSIGDWVKQFLVAPPFSWRWNRAFATFTTTAGTQDYPKALPAFGWLEKGTWNDGAGKTQELEVALNLGEETVQNAPVSIAANLDDDIGNITFRLMPVPDKTYTVTATYQKAAPLFTSINDTWAPIPDYYSYLYNQGFLAKTYEYWNDERFISTMQLFVRQAIAANSGLSDSQVNIFLGERLDYMRTQQRELQSSQSGRQGRGLF